MRVLTQLRPQGPSDESLDRTHRPRLALLMRRPQKTTTLELQGDRQPSTKLISSSSSNPYIDAVWIASALNGNKTRLAKDRITSERCAKKSLLLPVFNRLP